MFLNGSGIGYSFMLSLKRLRRYRILALLLLCSTFLIAGCQGYAVPEEIPESNFHLSRSAGSPRVALYIVVGLDPVHDFSDGLAHYTEHLVWNNISKAGAIKADQHSNAWTNHATIGYWLSGSKDDFPMMLKQLSSLFEPISVTQAFAKEEANIVLRERDFRIGNNVDADARIQMNKFLYKGNPLALTVIGDSKAIGKMNLNQAKALHEATHVPENSVLIVVGDLSRRDVNKAINASGIPELTLQTVSTSPTRLEFAGNGTEKYYVDKLDVQSRIMWRKLIQLESPIDFEVLDLRSRLLSYFLESNLPGGLAGPLRYEEFVARSFAIDV
jgi:predicted Zn-dependent peptidase